MDKIGVGSLFIVLLTGLFTGMVMALQALLQLKPFAATSLVGGMDNMDSLLKDIRSHPRRHLKFSLF